MLITIILYTKDKTLRKGFTQEFGDVAELIFPDSIASLICSIKTRHSCIIIVENSVSDKSLIKIIGNPCSQKHNHEMYLLVSDYQENFIRSLFDLGLKGIIRKDDYLLGTEAVVRIFKKEYNRKAKLLEYFISPLTMINRATFR